MSASRQYTSRFKETETLKTVSLLMTNLYKKEVELAKDARLTNDPNSIDSKKSAAVSELVSNVNSLIMSFNEEPEPIAPQEKLRHIVIFATHLQSITQATLDKYSEILLEPRNNKRKNANTATQALILGGAGLFAVTQLFPTGVAACVFGYQSNLQLKEITGMSDTDPASYRWIKGLNTVAINIATNAQRRLEAGARPTI